MAGTDLALKNVRAIVTTRWTSTRYTPRVIRAIESYYVDTSLDQDADTWTLDFGDVDEHLMRLFNRDSEIRVQLFGVGQGKGQRGYLMTGIADSVSTDEQKMVHLSGRDMSSLAMDSTCPPMHVKKMRAADLIKKQALELGIPGPFNLVSKGSVKKILRTDGSETYWEFWYRLARNEKMWLWCGPEGSLTMSPLRYGSPIAYTFGQPGTSKFKGIFIPVETIQVAKQSQNRIYRIETYGHFGTRTFKVVEEDPSIRDWRRRPSQVVYDSSITTKKGASKNAKESIFEGKVGSVELTVTIGDPGLFVHTNRIAHVDLPAIGIVGTFYIVGVRRNAGMDGFTQEIRLREKNYAISRRVPEEPRPSDSTSPGAPTLGKLPDQLASAGINWTECFIKAAEKWRGPWNMSLYLACLLGICHVESSFENKRSYVDGDGRPAKGETRIEWYEWNPTRDESNRSQPATDANGRTENEWKTAFANEPGQWANGHFAVGPMQLYSQSYKDKADSLYGRKGQFDGGRWDPCSNIMVGAEVLRAKLKGSVGDTGRDADIWEGVWRYNGSRNYGSIVKKAVESSPGYLAIVEEALQATREDTGETDQLTTDQIMKDAAGKMTQGQAVALMRMRPVGGGYTEIQKRMRVEAAAMIGYYNRDDILWDDGASRDDDVKPYPNIPATTDCSGFASWCYRSAGSDIFSTGDWTGSQQQKGRHVSSISEAQTGDLIFYSNHVTVYIGGGECVSHGQDEGPSINTWNYKPVVQIRSYL